MKKMKLVLTLLSVVLAFAACEKCYECTLTDTAYDLNGNEIGEDVVASASFCKRWFYNDLVKEHEDMGYECLEE